MDEANWSVAETEFDPIHLLRQETVFTLGNGYLGTRGTFEEGYPDARPATLVHGIYDDAPIVYTELANCPDWLPLHILVEGERFRLDRGKIVYYRRQLDLRRATLCREVHWQSPGGRTLALVFERFASLADPHLVAIRCQVTAVDFEGAIQVYASLNGYPDNMGLSHWDWVDQGSDSASVWLHTVTRHSRVELGLATRLTASGAVDPQVNPMNCYNCPSLTATFHARPGQTVHLEKLVTIFSSRETDAPARAARAKLADLADYATLLAAHEQAWEQMWEASDVLIKGDPIVQLAVRHSLFQILIAPPRGDDRVSISAKTLSGFGYRGHVFWDTEIFVLPFLTYTQPVLARNLLTYRYHTLPGARRKARQAGYEGAMFAWESADTGDEVTPRWVPGPRGEELVRIWCGDIELHITADVAYAVWNYWRATGDDEWMCCYGAEILLDTAVFWGSRAEWDPECGRYEISDVIGPDEYHEHIDNNAFTNRMVRWHLDKAMAVLDWLQTEHPDRATTLTQELGLTQERFAHWRDVRDRIYVPHDPWTGMIEQFEGFFDRKDIDLADYEPRDTSMQVVLGIQGANQHQVLKQADVLMLLYLLRDDYDRTTLNANWDYYAPRTDHTYGSSLGPAIHAIVASALGKSKEAYQHFVRAALVDLEDVRGNAADGVHAASAGGLWQAIVFGFAGIRLTRAGPVALPRLPPNWTQLKFRLCHHDRWYDFDLRSPDGLPDIRGVIFDLDGVLTDTSEYHYLAWKRLADEERIPFDRRGNEALRGVSRRESLIRLLNGRPATEEQIQQMMARKDHYYQEYIAQLTDGSLLPGALELLQEIKAAGLRVAIGSASKNARTVIDRLGIADLVDAISDGHSVERQKPAPDLFLHAVAQLGLQPAQCVVIEDAESGVKAALEGGMWAIGLGPDERVGMAHVVLASLDSVHWPALLAELGQRMQ